MSSRHFANTSTTSKCAALFPKTVEACQELAGTAKDRATESLRKIYDIPPSQRTFSNTAAPLDISRAEHLTSCSILSVVVSVSPLQAVRDEARKQIVDLESFSIDNFESNRRLYAALKEVNASQAYVAEYVKGGKNAEYSYWMEEQLADYRRKGMELPDEEFEAVVQVQKDLAALSTQFQRILARTRPRCTSLRMK